MKIKRIKSKTKQLLKFHVIKSRVYDKNEQINSLPNVNISKLIIKLKKSLQIIFRYHKEKKRILFIGIPEIIETKINSETNHIAIPNFYNIYGLFVNKSVLKSLRLKYQILKKSKRITFSN